MYLVLKQPLRDLLMPGLQLPDCFLSICCGRTYSMIQLLAHTVAYLCSRPIKKFRSCLHFHKKCQKVPIVEFQSQFYMSKIIRIFLKNFFVEHFFVTGGPRLVRFLGPGKNRTMRDLYQLGLHSQFPLVRILLHSQFQKFHQY